MGQVTLRGHVEAPIEQVFDYAVDFRHTAEWNVSVVEMHGDKPLAKVGDRFSGRMKMFGRVYDGEGEVTIFDRPKVLAFVSTSSLGGRQDWTSRFTPAGTGTDVESMIEYEVPGSILGTIADKLFVEREIQRMLEQSRDNFKAQVEHAVLQPA
jgi:coenzyme Q-binding protein COQ10